MTATRRWCVVVAGFLVFGLLPFVVKSLPVDRIDLSAAALLSKAQASTAVAYSGYVESDGNLSLPISDQFSDVSDLLGGRTTMRVWWRGPGDWRVDKLTIAGETDLFHDLMGTTAWNYEADRAVRNLNARVRLPMTSDLLPPAVARLALTSARRDEVTRLGSTRVAGLDTAGLRLRPRGVPSSIDHVDIEVEPRSGLPLRVAVFARGTQEPALVTTFLDVTIKPPPAAVTAFTLPSGADIRYEDVVDVAAAANRYAPLRAPARLADMSRRDTGGGAVGVYGRGLTELVAIPLWAPAAYPLRRQLAVTPGSARSRHGMTLGVGPVHLLLTGPGFANHSWLLAGTVPARTLVGAATELAVRHGAQR